MLSDTLFDAAEEIRRYRAEYPGYYEDYAMELDRLLRQMDDIRTRLDTPPSA